MFEYWIMYEYLIDVYHTQFQARCSMVFPAQCWLLRWYQKASSRSQSLPTLQFPLLSEIYWLSSSPCVSTRHIFGSHDSNMTSIDNQLTVWSRDCHMTTNLQCGHMTVTWLPTYSVVTQLSHDYQPTVWSRDCHMTVTWLPNYSVVMWLTSYSVVMWYCVTSYMTSHMTTVWPV